MQDATRVVAASYQLLEIAYSIQLSRSYREDGVMVFEESLVSRSDSESAVHERERGRRRRIHIRVGII